MGPARGAVAGSSRSFPAVPIFGLLNFQWLTPDGPGEPPGGIPGRLTLFSENAIDKMKNDNLFTDSQKKETKEKESSAEKPKAAKIIKQTPSKPKREE